MQDFSAGERLGGLVVRHLSGAGGTLGLILFPGLSYHLIGPVVKASASRVKDRGFESCLRWFFSWSSHTSDLRIGTPVATLPGT